MNDGFLVGPRFRFRAQQRVKTFVQLMAGVDQGPAFCEIDPAHLGLCIAIDPKDPKGIWWWDAGRSG